MMEKGSFHASPGPNSPTALTDEMVKNIPLPNQLPNGVNFRDIPAGPMKSSTLESLISQNEDLMARLSVSLRKANQFEEKSAVLEKENQSYHAQVEALSERFQLLAEKDRMFSSRSAQLLEENSHVKEHQQKLEKVYSELYVQAQAFQRRLQYLERYRVRIQRAAPAVQERSKRLAPVEQEAAQIRKTLSISHMQSVNSYEAKLADCRHEIEILRGKANERDQIFEEKVRIHNQLVHEQRAHQLLREDTSLTIHKIENENSEISLQLKQALLIQESQRVEIVEIKTKLPTLEEENKTLKEQVESLQALWAHKQRELDGLEEKNRALQKLNQSLSVSLNQQRKDSQTLQTEMDSERFIAKDRIKMLTEEIEMLRAQTIET